MAVRFTYWLPKSLSLGDSPGDDKHKNQTRLVAREIPIGEQMNVADALSGAKLMHELGSRMLVEVDGIPVTPENKDEVWHRFNAKQRDLMFKLYRRLHVVEEADVESFFASEGVVASEG